MLAGLGRGATILRVLQRIAEIRDVVHGPFELPDDHRDPLISLSLQLVSRAGERRRGEVRVGMSVQPCDPSTDAQTPAKTEREPAAAIADKRKHDHAGRYRGDPRDVAVAAGGRRGPVPLRGLRVGRAEGAVLARLVL